MKIRLLSALLFALALDPAKAISQDINKMDHVHSTVEIPSEIDAPHLGLRLYRDAMSGLNLHLVLQDYQLEPPELSGNETQSLRGHAHLFVNGKKVARLYGNFYHLPDKLLRSGLNQVTVTLNDHQHNTWSSNGHRLFATSFLNLANENWLLHAFSSSPGA